VEAFGPEGRRQAAKFLTAMVNASERERVVALIDAGGRGRA
jgi:hypothetical protein